VQTYDGSEGTGDLGRVVVVKVRAAMGLAGVG